MQFSQDVSRMGFCSCAVAMREMPFALYQVSVASTDYVAVIYYIYYVKMLSSKYCISIFMVNCPNSELCLKFN